MRLTNERDPTRFASPYEHDVTAALCPVEVRAWLERHGFLDEPYRDMGVSASTASLGGLPVGSSTLRLALLVLALLLPSCIPLGRDERLTTIAREEWTRVGVPDRFLDLSINGQHCIGAPGVVGWDGLTMCVPWPWSEVDWITRIIMRYELSKAGYQLHGQDRDNSFRWYGPVLMVDGLFHGPPSELHSWFRVFFPGDILYDKIDHGPPVVEARGR